MAVNKINSKMNIFIIVLLLKCFFAQTEGAGTLTVDSGQDICATCKCRDGRDGKDGRDGNSVQGLPGRDGRDGHDGKDCVECARGPIGPKGGPGEPGKAGQRGPPGAEGQKGDQGPQGMTGKNGTPGAAGRKGDTGAKGATGSQGPKGVCDQATLKKMMDDIKSLQSKLTAAEAKIKTLESSTVKLQNGRIAQSVLPGAYAKYTVENIQWASMHMAAAAACRGSTATGGSGPAGNAVLPRASAQSCNTICAQTQYKTCDGEVSILGSGNQASGHVKEVGSFYNYGCVSAPVWGDETKMKADASLTGSGGYISYCCCRKP